VSLLVGSQLIGIVAREYDWVFDFAGGVSIVAESHWRLIDEGRVVLTDEDHGQKFGLKEPVDALPLVQTELNDSEVLRAEFSPVSDLLLSFANGRGLQVLIGSAGYENWHVYGPDSAHTFAIGGGELCREAR
jgi:hypothetical protein